MIAAHSRRVVAPALLVALVGCQFTRDHGGPAPSPISPSSRTLEGATARRFDFLLESYDSDRDGAVSRAEYRRDDRAFGNLDRDGDGAITAADFARGAGRGDARPDAEAKSRQVARRIFDVYGCYVNTDGQPGITRAEWTSAIDALGIDDDTRLTAANFEPLLGPDGAAKMAPMVGMMFRTLDVDGDDDAGKADLLAAFDAVDANDDGVASTDEVPVPPGVGEVAPDFTLRHADDPSRSVTLSSFRGDKPVALIFGSYT